MKWFDNQQMAWLMSIHLQHDRSSCSCIAACDQEVPHSAGTHLAASAFPANGKTAAFAHPCLYAYIWRGVQNRSISMEVCVHTAVDIVSKGVLIG